MTPDIEKELVRIEARVEALIDEALKLHYELERILELRPSRSVLRMPRPDLNS